MKGSVGAVLRGLGRTGYQSELGRPEWLEFRQRVKTAKGGRCEVCRRQHGLQVHHNFYDSERWAWEYAMDEVRLLCGVCHEAFEEALRNFRQFVAPRLTPSQFKVLNGALAVGLKVHDRTALLGAIVNLVSSVAEVARLSGTTERTSRSKESLSSGGQTSQDAEKRLPPETVAQTLVDRAK